jgi:hypothetical protein
MVDITRPDLSHCTTSMQLLSAQTVHPINAIKISCVFTDPQKKLSKHFLSRLPVHCAGRLLWKRGSVRPPGGEVPSR